MIHKRFTGITVCIITFLSVAIFGGNYLYAQPEIHKFLEKGLAPEHKVEELFVCPQCKEVRMSPIKGRTLATMTMVCPDCKNEISEFAVHHCDVCGEDVLACVLCKRETAMLRAETMMKTECPKCKEVRVRPIKGRALAKLRMKCPDCKKKTKEWLIMHCDTCGTDFLACPICKKAQEKELKKATK